MACDLPFFIRHCIFYYFLGHLLNIFSNLFFFFVNHYFSWFFSEINLWLNNQYTYMCRGCICVWICMCICMCVYVCVRLSLIHLYFFVYFHVSLSLFTFKLGLTGPLCDKEIWGPSCVPYGSVVSPICW